MYKCYKCDAVLDTSATPSLKELCASCGAYVRCCRNCALYDEFAHNRCKSSTTEMVADREKSNFCDEFKIRAASGSDSGSGEGNSKKLWNGLWRS